MRSVLSFLVRLLSFWTWKDFFVRWLWSPASHPASGETAEHLPSQEGQPESELARFLSSLPEDERQCNWLEFYQNSIVEICFGRYYKRVTLFHGAGVEASYREFLEAVASSEIVFDERVSIFLRGDESCEHVEAIADALRQSGNGFRKLFVWCWDGSAVRHANCVSSVLLGNKTIQDLELGFRYFWGAEKRMGEQWAAEVAAIIAGPHILPILKSFVMPRLLDDEGVEELLKPFQGPPSALEYLYFQDIRSDAQFDAGLKHIPQRSSDQS